MNSLVELNNVVEKHNYSPDDSHTEAINKVLAAFPTSLSSIKNWLI